LKTIACPIPAPFCEELLERYAEDRHIGMRARISARAYRAAEAKAYFSRCCRIWAATRRRACKLAIKKERWPTLLAGKAFAASAENFCADISTMLRAKATV
jgi:hypothetical protein